MKRFPFVFSKAVRDRLERQLQPRARLHINMGFVSLKYRGEDWLNELVRFPLDPVEVPFG